MEMFKVSKKSICNGCSNLNAICSLIDGKICETDNLIGKAYVSKCGYYNKNINVNKFKKRNIVTVDFKTDTRIEMMGGGHSEKVAEK